MMAEGIRSITGPVAIVSRETPLADIRPILLLIKVPTADTRGDVEWIGVCGSSMGHEVAGLRYQTRSFVPPGGIAFT